MLIHSVREKALRGLRLEKASILSVREKLMLYTISIRILKSKIYYPHSIIILAFVFQNTFLLQSRKIASDGTLTHR